MTLIFWHAANPDRLSQYNGYISSSGVIDWHDLLGVKPLSYLPLPPDYVHHTHLVHFNDCWYGFKDTPAGYRWYPLDPLADILLA